MILHSPLLTLHNDETLKHLHSYVASHAAFAPGVGTVAQKLTSAIAAGRVSAVAGGPSNQLKAQGMHEFCAHGGRLSCSSLLTALSQLGLRVRPPRGGGGASVLRLAVRLVRPGMATAL